MQMCKPGISSQAENDKGEGNSGRTVEVLTVGEPAMGAVVDGL